VWGRLRLHLKVQFDQPRPPHHMFKVTRNSTLTQQRHHGFGGIRVHGGVLEFTRQLQFPKALHEFNTLVSHVTDSFHHVLHRFIVCHHRVQCELECMILLGVVVRINILHLLVIFHWNIRCHRFICDLLIIQQQEETLAGLFAEILIAVSSRSECSSDNVHSRLFRAVLSYCSAEPSIFFAVTLEISQQTTCRFTAYFTVDLLYLYRWKFTVKTL